MKTFQVWFKKAPNARAPEYVFLDEDYEWKGEMKAESPKDLVRQITITNANDSELLEHRPPNVGDVLEEDNGIGHILTPLGVWSQVKIVRSDDEIIDE